MESAVAAHQPFPVCFTAYDLALRWLGLQEQPGAKHEPWIVAFHSVSSPWFATDEVAWCSSFLDAMLWILDAPRAASARARDWMKVGREVRLEDAVRGWDVIVLKRGGDGQPGPEVLDAPGHVMLYAQHYTDESGQTWVEGIGGNQGKAGAVTVARYPASRVLACRRLRG